MTCTPDLNRRGFLGAALAGSVALPALAQSQRDYSGHEPARYPDPDIVVLDKRFAKYKIGNTSIQRLYTGLPLGRRAGVERVGTLPGLERYSQRPADALARRRRPRQRVAQQRRQQQRQHVRLRGPPAFLRARHAPRRALRTQRQADGARRQVAGQAVQRAQRHRRASRRRHLVHRSRLRHPRLSTKGTSSHCD